MASATLNIRMDEKLKDEVDETAREIGITSTAAFNVFARQFVAHRGFPFPVTVPTPSEREFAHQMDGIYQQMQAGSQVEHGLIED